MGSTHTLITATRIAKEALMLLKNNLVMGSNVYRAYEGEFPGSPKGGGSLTIRKPVKFSVTKARTRATSTISESSITMTVATQAHVSWAFNTKDLTLSIEEYSERYIRPAASILANTIDADLCALYDDIAQSVWESTGFVHPNTFMVLGKALQKLDENACPQEDRVIVLNPAGHWSMANALSNWNFSQGGEQALRKGKVGQLANCEIYMDQNIKVHTVGNYHDSGSTGTDALHIFSTTTGPATLSTTIQLIDFRVVNTRVLVVGDVFTVANVYAVNPMSGESTGSLNQFVVTADASCAVTETTSGGKATVYIQPDLVETGPYKVISALPAAGASITMVGNEGSVYPQNLCFHRNAFALCMVPLEKPDGVAFASTASEDGFSIRVVKQYDIDKDDEVIRMDILYGVKTIYPELACRIWGLQTT